MRGAGATAALLAACLASRAAAQTPDVGTWPLEEVVTSGGKTYRGLIRAETDEEVEFVEVVQPRGKPMYLVVRPIDPQAIVSRERLPDAQRKQLRDRVYAFRYRSRIEAGRMESVRLVRREDDGRKFWRYRGPWFTLDSTADEETTRRCVVRVVQIFRAYRQILPPRVEPARPLRVLIFASMDEYKTFLAKHDLDISNPAVYARRGNLIIAASELTRYAERLAAARARHNTVRKQYEQLDARLGDQLAALRRRLSDAGVERRKIDDEINARKAQWDADRIEALGDLNAADRRNERRFNDVTREMFRRLYHEAFHAYLENYVYPSDQFDAPVWLHEGLAQVFQSGILEADTLRIDAPLADALRAVQRDLRSDDPLLLDDLLAAGPREFLQPDDANAQRLYAHAWAIAYYLTFYQPVLGTAALDEYVAGGADPRGAARRFQTLVGMPLSEYEQRWQAAILSLPPAR